MQTLNGAVSANTLQCSTCGNYLSTDDRFCGACGALSPAQGMTALTMPAAPSFAMVAPMQTATVTNELHAEAAKLYILLARERVLLLIHWAMFIGLNFLGCWLAYKCYCEFLGDEMSKIMVASTPFLFINSVALLGIVLIKGTRREIARVKERISYVKFKIDFGHLM